MNTAAARLQGFLALLLERLGPMPLVALCAIAVTVAFALLTPALVRRYPQLWPMPANARRSLFTDWTYGLLSPVSEVFARTLTMGAVALVALLLGQSVEPALLHGFGPLARQPHWLIVAEMLVLSDFIFYWTHRMAHRVPLLWKLHAIHHSTEHMNAAAALRVHPFEAYALVLNSLPLFALGFPLDALFPLAPISFFYALFIHSNLSFGIRRFSYLFNSPAYHRWHHSRHFRDYGSNYAGFFPLMDALFGSYHFPKEPPEELGIEDKSMPGTYLGQVLHPLQPASSKPSEAAFERTEQPAQGYE